LVTREEDTPMPRPVNMTWEAPKLRWRKLYHGQLYTVSCAQLREQGYAVDADTKEGSLGAANLWWSRKEAQIRMAEQPPPRPLSEVEKLIFAAKCKDPSEWEQAAREMDAAGAKPEEIAKIFASIICRLAERAEPETPCVEKHLPEARVELKVNNGRLGLG